MEDDGEETNVDFRPNPSELDGVADMSSLIYLEEVCFANLFFSGS